MQKLLYLFAAGCLFASCQPKDSKTENFVAIQGIDSSLKPGDNFSGM